MCDHHWLQLVVSFLQHINSIDKYTMVKSKEPQRQKQFFLSGFLNNRLRFIFQYYQFKQFYIGARKLLSGKMTSGRMHGNNAGLMNLKLLEHHNQCPQTIRVPTQKEISDLKWTLIKGMPTFFGLCIFSSTQSPAIDYYFFVGGAVCGLYYWCQIFVTTSPSHREEPDEVAWASD